MTLFKFLSSHRLFITLLFSVFIISGCGKKVTQYPVIPAGSVVLALGDSLTAGYGASEEAAYPTRLATATNWTVINGGVSGNTSAQALERLPDLLKTYQPRLVIISIGGNDFLRQIPENETRHNIEQIITLSRAEGAEVLLVGVPKLTPAAMAGFPNDHELYADIAKQKGIQLYSKGWANVLKQSEWRSDQIHPNAIGYGEFTRHFVDFLRDSGRLQ